MLFKKFKQKRFLKQLAKQMQQKHWFQEVQIAKQDMKVRVAMRNANNIHEAIQAQKEASDRGEKTKKNDNKNRAKVADQLVETESNAMEAVNRQLEETKSDIAQVMKLLAENF